MIVADPNVATMCGTPRREVKIDRRDAYALAESLGLGSTVRCGPPQLPELKRDVKPSNRGPGAGPGITAEL